ncbi:Auxin-induced protein AUX28-like protein [Drosera capensis]
MAATAKSGAYSTVDFEETELRLGLPGNGGGGSEGEAAAAKNGCKRGFRETERVELKLNSITVEGKGVADQANPPAKAQVVGWPPVRSFRKNVMAVQKNNTHEEEKTASGCAAFVKVSLDGAPYLRKVDLKLYKSYQELSDALGKMFISFTIGNCGSDRAKNLLTGHNLMDPLNLSDYMPTYEDKDGDWMLVGDDVRRNMQKVANHERIGSYWTSTKSSREVHKQKLKPELKAQSPLLN